MASVGGSVSRTIRLKISRRRARHGWPARSRVVSTAFPLRLHRTIRHSATSRRAERFRLLLYFHVVWLTPSALLHNGSYHAILRGTSNPLRINHLGCVSPMPMSQHTAMKSDANSRYTYSFLSLSDDTYMPSKRSPLSPQQKVKTTLCRTSSHSSTRE